MHTEFEEPPGATPLNADDRLGLLPTWVTTRKDLDEVEAVGIAGALVFLRRTRPKDCLSEDFVISLHRRMFADVWRWAGTFRRREVSIGVDPLQIRPRLRQLLDDARYWVEHDTYSVDEIAVRLHHQMVWIHPFPNGNGRHTRLMADVLAQQLGRPAFTWGGELASDTPVRRTYIATLRTADNHDIRPLLAFARS